MYWATQNFIEIAYLSIFLVVNIGSWAYRNANQHKQVKGTDPRTPRGARKISILVQFLGNPKSRNFDRTSEISRFWTCIWIHQNMRENMVDRVTKLFFQNFYKNLLNMRFYAKNEQLYDFLPAWNFCHFGKFSKVLPTRFVVRIFPFFTTLIFCMSRNSSNKMLSHVSSSMSKPSLQAFIAPPRAVAPQIGFLPFSGFNL